MSRLRAVLCCALALSAVIAGAGVPVAGASHGQATFFEAPAELLNPATRPRAIAKLQRLGVSALRIELNWHTVAPSANSRRRPSFDATDPAAYAWGQYDPLIEQARGLGWKVLLTVTSPVPRWAQANTASRTLVERPNSGQFGQFMTAVGRHFGSEVTMFAVWNEPNHHEFLEPQFSAGGQPLSPRIYRALYQAGYAGLQAAGISHPIVLLGETAPEGQSHVRPSTRFPGNVAPLEFLRGTLCLGESYRRAGSCSKLATAGYAIHPYPSAAGPLSVPFNRESVTIGSLSRISSALDLSARAHAVPAHLPIYITEFGIMSKPNRYQGVAPSLQAEYDAISERIAFANPRVASFAQYLLKDDPLPRRRSRAVGFQTGLEYFSGAPKPSFSEFSLPLVVARRGGRYELWGFVRPAGAATTLTVEVQTPHSSRFRKLAQATTDSGGYWTLRSSVPGTRWRARWVSPGGARYLGPPVRAR
jgi:hypothetical protein